MVTKELVARLCHEVNRSYCEAIGDNSQASWEEAPQWQKESAIKGVEAHWANPNLSPQEGHDLWVKQKISEGWMYGKEKNAELKQHPCIINYMYLPASQRAKDYIFKTICNVLQPEEKTPDMHKTLGGDNANTRPMQGESEENTRVEGGEEGIAGT